MKDKNSKNCLFAITTLAHLSQLKAKLDLLGNKLIQFSGGEDQLTGGLCNRWTNPFSATKSGLPAV